MPVWAEPESEMELMHTEPGSKIQSPRCEGSWEDTDYLKSGRRERARRRTLTQESSCQHLLISNSKCWCWHGGLEGSVARSGQAAIQQCIHASVLCSVTDLSGLSLLYGISWSFTRYRLISPLVEFWANVWTRLRVLSSLLLYDLKTHYLLVWNELCEHSYP